MLMQMQRTMYPGMVRLIKVLHLLTYVKEENIISK